MVKIGAIVETLGMTRRLGILGMAQKLGNLGNLGVLEMLRMHRMLWIEIMLRHFFKQGGRFSVTERFSYKILRGKNTSKQKR